MEHSFLNARIVDRVDIPKRHPLDRGFVVQESNAVFYRKNLGDATVMMCDYIDEDELHPYRTSGRIRKDISVGYVGVASSRLSTPDLRSHVLACLCVNCRIVLSPHVNADGSSSVVMKRFSFIKNHFGKRQPTPEILQAISTRVILWGQAVRSCIVRRRRPKDKPIWIKYTFPRMPPSVASATTPSQDTTPANSSSGRTATTVKAVDVEISSPLVNEALITER